MRWPAFPSDALTVSGSLQLSCLSLCKPDGQITVTAVNILMTLLKFNPCTNCGPLQGWCSLRLCLQSPSLCAGCSWCSSADPCWRRGLSPGTCLLQLPPEHLCPERLWSSPALPFCLLGPCSAQSSTGRSHMPGGYALLCTLYLLEECQLRDKLHCFAKIQGPWKPQTNLRRLRFKPSSGTYDVFS